MPAVRFPFPFAVAAILTAVLFVAPTSAEQQGPTVRPPEERPPMPAVSPPKPVCVDVVFADGSLLKMRVLDESFAFVTSYGLLKIPVRAIRRVEFGFRMSEGERAAVDAAVADLTGSVPARRETAKAALRSYGPRAVPALRRAERTADGEVAAYVLDVLGDLAPGRADADPRDYDVIATDDSQIAGHLVAESIRVMTAQFGEQRLKFEGVRSIEATGSAAALADTGGTAEDAPPTMLQFAGRRGQVIRLRVTAGIGGTVWGTRIHTLDSHLPTAAVHAGVLQPGQAGVVRVRIVDSPPAFVGSTQHGVTSHPYGAFPQGGYEILTPGRR